MQYIVGGIVAVVLAFALIAWSDGAFCHSDLCKAQWQMRIAREAAPVAPIVVSPRPTITVPPAPSDGLVVAGYRGHQPKYRTVDEVIASQADRSGVLLGPGARGGRPPVVEYGKPHRGPNGQTVIPFSATDFGRHPQPNCDHGDRGTVGVGVVGEGRDRWSICANRR